MLPDFERFAKRYLHFASLGLWLISLLLCVALVRNTVAISLTEMLFGLGTISLSLCWNMLRDQRGYWVYSLYALKLYEPAEKIEQLQQYISKQNWRRHCYHPWSGSLLTLGLVALLCLLQMQLPASYRSGFILLMGAIVLPQWLSWLLKRSLLFSVIWAVNQKQQPIRPRPRHISLHLSQDLLFNLIVNVALVFPLAYKPSFSLAKGYSDPAFVVAFIILLEIVLLLMLLFVRRTRRYHFCGELLCGLVDDQFAHTPPWRWSGWRSLWLRGGIYTLLIAGWSILLCGFFEHYIGGEHFIGLYLVGLLPLVLVFTMERYRTLYVGFREGQKLVQQINHNTQRLQRLN